MIGELIYSRLSGFTDGRVYPQVMPQDAGLPAVTYTQLSALTTHAFGGDVPVIRYRMQVDVWAETYAGVKALAAQVKGALSRYRDVDVQDVLFEGELDGFDNGTRRVTQDYYFYMNESE